MRPIRLELRAFGSYPGTEVVDFDALSRRGLFAVTGPTGSGKTMIFDAMAWALYGVLPGQRQGDGDARSHHAPIDTDTSVTLDFEVDGARYRVYRQPAWHRPKKRGEGTTLQPAKATLVRLDGNATTPMATLSAECSRQCRELIGLEALEFQRVVLLPQGEFNRFLLATDDDREKLLRNLFGGELYERAVDWLKKRVNRLEDEVRDIDVALQHDRLTAVASLKVATGPWKPETDPGRLDAMDDDLLCVEIDELGTARAAHQQALDAVRRELASLTAQKSVADEAARRFDAAEVARRALANLETQREAIATARAAAEASRRARPVVGLGERAEQAKQRVADAKKACADAEAAVAAGLSTFGTSLAALHPAGVAAAVQEVAQRVEAERKALAEVQAAKARLEKSSAELAAAQSAHQALLAAVAEIRSTQDELEAEIAGLAPRAALLPDSRAAYERATRRHEVRAQLEEASEQLRAAEAHEARAKTDYERTMANFVATQAPRLAEQLAEGVPCPVCGSTEHPSPAQLSEGKAADHEEVDKSRKAWAKASGKAEQARGVVGAKRSELGEDAELGVEVFVAAMEAARVSLEQAEHASNSLAAARLALEAHVRELAGTADRERRKGEEVVALQARVGGERDALAVVAEGARGVDAGRVDVRTKALRTLQKTSADYARLYDRSNRAESEHEALDAQLHDALAAGGYPTLAAAREQMTSEELERQSLEQARAWDASVAEHGTRLRQLQEQGVLPVRPDVEALADDLVKAHARATDAERTFTTASNAVDAARAAMTSLFERASATADLREQLTTARTVFKTCNGEAGIRVKLERWVLAGELDRVTKAANVYLTRMTNSRYRLERVRGNRGGLSLEAFDAHTGRARSPASLSGGEQFQASLALALGLADVVSQGGLASGKRFEALFVDEGFGSLDPDSLDDAIYALSMLQATGRVVGVITHVEAMKERLHVGIEVRRLAEGRGSTLVVNP